MEPWLLKTWETRHCDTVITQIQFVVKLQHKFELNGCEILQISPRRLSSVFCGRLAVSGMLSRGGREAGRGRASGPRRYPDM